MISEGIASAEQKAKEASPRMAPLRVPFKRRLQTAAGEEKEQHLVLYTIISLETAHACHWWQSCFGA